MSKFGLYMQPDDSGPLSWAATRRNIKRVSDEDFRKHVWGRRKKSGFFDRIKKLFKRKDYSQKLAFRPGSIRSAPKRGKLASRPGLIEAAPQREKPGFIAGFGQAPVRPRMPINIFYSYPYGYGYRGSYSQPTIPTLPSQLLLPPEAPEIIIEEPKTSSPLKDFFSKDRITLHLPSVIITLILAFILFR
jgi:hypothetical protein